MKIALLGSAPSSRKLAPFGDLNWEIWSCSPPNYDAPRVEAWFELHHLDRKMQMAQNAPYINVIKKHPRVYIAVPDKRFPNAIVYPKDRMLEKYGNYFFTSSLAWMMAMAIEQKPEWIGLWGVDMSAMEEYGYQRAGMHYFMQKAYEAGISIYIPPQSDLQMGPPLYGYKEQYPMYWKQKVRREELQERLNKARSTLEHARKEELVFMGALDDIEYQCNTWLCDTREHVMAPAPFPTEAKPNGKANGEFKEVSDGENKGRSDQPGAQELGGSA